MSEAINLCCLCTFYMDAGFDFTSSNSFETKPVFAGSERRTTETVVGGYFQLYMYVYVVQRTNFSSPSQKKKPIHQRYYYDDYHQIIIDRPQFEAKLQLELLLFFYIDKINYELKLTGFCCCSISFYIFCRYRSFTNERLNLCKFFSFKCDFCF